MCFCLFLKWQVHKTHQRWNKEISKKQVWHLYNPNDIKVIQTKPWCGILTIYIYIYIYIYTHHSHGIVKEGSGIVVSTSWTIVFLISNY